MLTSHQCRLLYFLRDYIVQSGGVSPSLSTMAEGMGLKSKSGIHRLLTALEIRGFIRRRHNCARSVTIVHMPTVPVEPTAADLRDIVERLCEAHGAGLIIIALCELAHELTERQQASSLANVAAVGSA